MNRADRLNYATEDLKLVGGLWQDPQKHMCAG